MRKQKHLSVVATSRNDNHGGSLTTRMQHFVDGFVTQCIRHRLDAELILVEWNPPADRRRLAEELTFPSNTGSCEIRIITVPKGIHDRYQCANDLPLFQMIAKNVGIRRARGAFVVATNIDILFSDEVILYMRDRLAKGMLYRVDRYDIPHDLPDGRTFEDTLQRCMREAIRVHRRNGSYLRSPHGWVKEGPTRKQRWLARMHRMAGRLQRGVSPVRWARGLERGGRSLAHAVRFVAQSGIRPTFRAARNLAGGAPLRRAVHAARWRAQSVSRAMQEQARRYFGERAPHCNACGDFTLMAFEDWDLLRGYPEWGIFSWHLDSVLMYQARYANFKEIDLPPNVAVYHIEHGAGSGYTPESADLLFSRLDRKGIPYLTWPAFKDIVIELRKAAEEGRSVSFNEPTWGLADEQFEEWSTRR